MSLESSGFIKMNKEAFSSAMKILTSFNPCCRVYGFGKLHACQDGTKVEETWYALTCEKAGQFIVCASCKILYQILYRKQAALASSFKRKPMQDNNKRYYKRRAKKLAIDLRSTRQDTKLKLSLQQLSLQEVEKKLLEYELPRLMVSNIIHAIKTVKVESASRMR